ncbi:MAG TPA: hypothetical protein VGF69_05955 [Thermoanaerobaculia bacterium]
MTKEGAETTRIDRTSDLLDGVELPSMLRIVIDDGLKLFGHRPWIAVLASPTDKGNHEVNLRSCHTVADTIRDVSWRYRKA